MSYLGLHATLAAAAPRRLRDPSSLRGRDRVRCARAVALVAVVATAAVGGWGDDRAPPGGGLGACDGAVVTVASEPGVHVNPGQDIQWSSNPPATGRHYPAWAGWNRSYTSLQRGYWIHNLEHGGVVLLHNCPDGCADDLAALRALAGQLPADSRCAAPIRNRVLVVADPQLPSGVRFAAAAWGAYYTATCLDLSALTAFYQDRHGRAPEDLCGDGLSMGGERLP